MVRAAAYLVFLSSFAFAQVPQILSDGVVNSASWASPVAPGSLVSIFGSNLATTTQSASGPLPFTLGGTSVTINGVPAPLSFVSPGQINLQMPSSLTVPSTVIAPGTAQIISLGSATAIVTAPGGMSAPLTFLLSSARPGFFTVNGSGCGQAAALNIAPTGAVSINSPSNSAAPGDYIALFGTGFGLATSQPSDGVAPTVAAPLPMKPPLLLDNTLTPTPSYAGLAPSLVGVDQVNFQLPASTRNGCAVPVSSNGILGSPPVTVSVQGGGGQCIDPGIQSYGQVSLNSLVSSGPGNSAPLQSAYFSAQFPSGPSIQPPAPPTVVLAPEWVGGLPPNTGYVGGILSPIPLGPSFSRTCTVPGYGQLSAGAVQVQSPVGMSVTANPLTIAGGVTYSQSLPAGFLGPGAYSISGTGDAVNLQTSVQVGSPIQIQTPLTPGTVISSSSPLTIKWTGGDPGTLVQLILYSGLSGLYTYANATGGSLTIPPFCSGNPVSAGGNGVVCSFGLPFSTNSQMVIDVLPAPANIAGIPALGITGKVQLSWSYSYVFAGLAVGP